MLAVKMPIPNLASYSLGALSGLFIFILLFFPSAQEAKQQQADNYGNALAKTAARRGVDAAFGNDLVGLRVILQDTVENPDVRVATVHDVENKLLVQAGELPYYPQTSDLMFTSAIILHDSIAGYVTVILSPSPAISSFSRALIIFWLLLFLAIATWSLWQHKSVEFYIPELWNKITKAGLNEEIPQPVRPKEKQQRSDNGLEAESGNAHTDDNYGDLTNNSAKDTEQESAKYLGYAVVGIKNFTVLQQQLNGEAFRSTFAAIESKVADVMNLYGGVDYQWMGDRYLLSFSSRESESEAIFHAACSAYLVLELSGLIQNIPLDMAASISNNADSLCEDSLPFSGLYTDVDGAQSASLSARVELMAYSEDHSKILITDFKQPYKALLENQRLQLEG